MSFERKIPVKSTPFSYLPLSDIGSLKRSIYPCKISNQQAQATLQQSRNGPVLQLYQYRHCCNCVHTTASLLFTIYSWTRHALKKDLSIALLQRSGTQVSTYRQHSLYWFLEGVRKCKNISVVSAAFRRRFKFPMYPAEIFISISDCSSNWCAKNYKIIETFPS